MNKIIIDSLPKKKSTHFALNLNDIGNIKNIDLDLKSIKDKFNKAIEKGNFTLAKEYLILGERLSSCNNENLNNMKLNYYFKYIIYKNSNSYKELLDFLDILNNIDIFYSLCYYLSNVLDFNIDESIRIVKEIENSINLVEILENKYKNKKNLSLKEIRALDKYLEENNDKNLKLLKDLLIESINNSVKNINNASNDNRVNFICTFLKDEYKEDFFVSKEFLYVINNYNEFENYYVLSEVSDKAYLLYKFNNAKNIYDRVEALYTNLIPDYLNLPIYYKEFVINELLEYKDKYCNIDEFFYILNDILIKVNLNSINKSNYIPV